MSHIKQKTESVLWEMDGISSDVLEKRRLYYSVACSDTFRFQLKRLLNDCVSETLALGYKNIFLRNCLKIYGGTFFQNVLVNTMCVFDKVYDQQIASKIVDVEQPIFIDGYYNFRLQTLRQKWKEVAALVSENIFILHDNSLIMEFLQYLMDSVPGKVSELSVTLEDNSFLMYDSKNNVLPSVQSLAYNPTVEEEAALNILLIKPKHLTVYYKNTPSQDFVLLTSLFDTKLQQVE